MRWVLAALSLRTTESAIPNPITAAVRPRVTCGFCQKDFLASCHGSGLPLASRSRNPALTRSAKPNSSSTSGLSRQKRSNSVAPFSGRRPERYRSTTWLRAMKSRSIGGVATDVCAAAAVAVAGVPAVVEVAAGVGAAAEVTEARDANVDGVDAAEGAGLDVFAGAVAGVLVAARGGAAGVGSSCGWLPDVAAIDMGAAGGSSERSWRDNSGSAVSSYAGAEGVEATGVEATGVGAGGTSRSNEVADSNGSKGSADSSSKEESVKPGLVATRATKAARALVLPVVDKAAEAVEDVGAASSGRGSDAAPAADVGAEFGQRPA